ncbi:MAG TPA: SOS response-associated peptidase [Firmicutes bacterium]|jgi:putative SOS response-associated peptidase YedK|nr:SOS response-associated peptidase [Bacillota bacterium]
MCFFYALSVTAQTLESRYQLKGGFEWELERELAAPKYYVSGFEFPKMPVLTNEQPDRFQALTWGLIPFWVKTPEQATQIRGKTLNARAETVLEKPAFRQAARRRRCLVPADGFYEWRAFQGKKYPYYIFLKDKTVFSFAGIWEEWVDPATGELLRTYSILTTEANSLLAKIHNTKKRMPVILPKKKERDWLQDGLDAAALQTLMQPFPAELMAAHPISRLITARTANRNCPEVQAPCVYPELD